MVIPLFNMAKYPPRHHCELCGRKLTKPETDSRKLAMCNKCIDKNLLGKMLRGEI